MKRTTELERAENLAKKLGFRIEYSNNLCWNHSKVHFYPSRKIVIGIKNYSERMINGYGAIPDKVKALFLKHEIGHIQVYLKLYLDMNLEDFCLSTDSEFKIQQEIYAWKSVLDESSDTLELELAQECINQYVLCEYVGTCTIEDSAKRQQEIITKFAHVQKCTQTFK